MILIKHYTDEAIDDLEEIIAYYDEQSDSAADHFQDAVNKTVEYLCESPQSGTNCWFKNLVYRNVRMNTLAKPFNNYLIFFRQEGETLQVLRILHGARNYKTLFK